METNILDDIEKIVTLANRHKLSQAFFENAKPHLEAVTALLRITETQAVFFSLILENSEDEGVSLGLISKLLKCGKIQMIKYMNDFEALEKKYLISAAQDNFHPHPSGSGGMPCYYIPLDVIKSLRNGRPYRNKKYLDINPETFFDTVRELFEARRDHEISPNAFIAELKMMAASNSKLAFINGLKTCNIGLNCGIHLMAFCCVWLDTADECISITELRPFLGYSETRTLERRLKAGDYKLVKEDILVNGNCLGIADTNTWTLTAKAREIFLADIDLKEKKQHSKRDVIKSDSIQECSLFYPKSVSSRIQELISLLKEENFDPVKKRLAEKKMASAFTILFKGPPGTGKTETAYQIARLTGRDIFLVDISETKSQWFGESEKRIKAVFDRYKGMIRVGGLTPIILFNEADAVLGKRQELGEVRRGPAQTENAIQNIILQEMENLKGGILIATTNLAVNLDKAFERRFLYKVEFEKPDNDARSAIWKNRLPELADDDASALSSRFDFSGGQIENIVKKQTIKTILHGGSVSLDGLAALCEDEIPDKAAKRIGFSV